MFIGVGFGPIHQIGSYEIMAHIENDAFLKAQIRSRHIKQWATIAHLGASIMFGKTIIYDAQWQVTLT